MTAVGELVLVLGLLVSAHCEVRARDPEVEEEEEEVRGGGGGGEGAFPPPRITRLHPGTTETPPLGETGNYPPRTGNWCAFVQKHMVKEAVVCGTEKYIIKSQSPCPSGISDCQLVMYKLSTRPVYTHKQKIYTTLQWACCQGYGGHNCEDTVPDPQLDSGSSTLSGGPGPESEELRAPELRTQLQQQQGDPNQEQNDYDANYTTQQHNTTHPTYKPDHALNLHHTWHHDAKTHDHGHQHQEHRQQEHRQQEHWQQEHRQQEHRQQEHHNPVAEEVDANVLPYPDTPAALPVPHMMALVMSQLQPVLQAFNRSLEHLSRQVGDLTRDVAQLKSSQQGPELQAGPPEGPELDDAAEELLDARLQEVFQDIREVQRQMESQRMDLENRLHSQHAMLHYNFTSLKTDIDVKLKRHQKMLQVSLQAMNTTLSELKLDQDRSLVDHLEGYLPPPSLAAPQPQQSSDTSGLWEAIERLDNVVVNNTVKVSGLMEDVEVTSGNVQMLKLDMKELVEKVSQTGRKSQVLFMETGLEVEEAKVAVLQRVNELAGNLTEQGKRLLEMDDDVDYLYTALSGDCGCKALKATVSRLEKSVANVTELAQENRIALEENSEGGDKQWYSTSDWAQTVEALQRGLQQVKESLASEQSRTSTLDHNLTHNLTQLSGLVMSSLAEVSTLKETDRILKHDMQNLSGSFTSLVKDANRHDDVLELLLEEEVLEFLQWPLQDQKVYSILGLKEQLREQGLSIALLLENRPGGREEVPSADQPSSSPHLLPSDMRRSSSSGVSARERQQLFHLEPRRPELREDGSDLWNLEKRVEELGLKVLRLQGKPCQCSNTSTEREVPPGGVDAELQAEVMWLKRGLEEHLRVFKNIFSNADVLARSDATLELDKLWELVKNKDGKKEKKRGGGGQEGRRGSHRSRRDSSGVPSVLSGLSDDSLLFVAGSPLGISNGSVTFKVSLRRGQFQPDTGTFTAPMGGIYLFALTLDLRPGPVHVVLRRGSGGALVSLHRQEVAEVGPVTGVGLLLLREGEEVRLELRRGVWVESEDNIFTGLLLHRTN